MSKTGWAKVVELMRGDLRALGTDPDQAWRAMLRFHASMDALMGQYQRATGLSQTELRSVLSLWDGGAMSVSELATRVNLSRTAATTLADRLEVQDLTERIADPNDRRRVRLRITRHAERLLEKTTHDLQDRLRDSVAADHSSWNALVEDLANIREAVLDSTVLLKTTLLEHERRSSKPRRIAPLIQADDYW